MNRLIFVLCLIMGTELHAQHQLSGVVKDLVDQQPLVGAIVSEPTTQNSTQTDTAGRFSLQVSGPNSTIEISQTAYLTKTIRLEGEKEIVASLALDALLIGDVVITALNLERASEDLGYSVESLSGSKLATVQSVNLLDNLSGQLAGVQVNQGATGVGSSSQIRIRGESSFTNNQPLFILDGLPIDNSSSINQTSDAAAGFQEVDFGNGAMDIHPNDIANISVLKGPSAAALYGTRAANGVIIINTKTGKDKSGLGISVNSSLFVDRAFKLPEFQNSYGQGNSGTFAFVDGLGGGVNDNITYSWGPAFSDGLRIPQFDSPAETLDGRTVRGGDVAVHGGQPIDSTPFRAYPNNLKDFYETGFTSINHIAFDQAFEKSAFRISLADLNSNSHIPGVDYKRKNVSARITTQVNRRLNMGLSAHYINSRSQNRPSGGYGSENINYSLVAWGPRSLNIKALEDYWQPGLEGLQQYSFNYTFFDNPYFILLENRNGFQKHRLIGQVTANYQFNPNLSLDVSSGQDLADEDRTFLRNASTNRFKQGAYAEQDLQFREVNHNFLLNFQDSAQDWVYRFSFGGNRMQRVQSQKQSEALSLAQPGVFNFSNASSALQIFQYQGEKRINSIYGFANLNFKEFWFVELAGRNDWSSALASPISTKNTAFFYPAISSSLILSKIYDTPHWLSLGKLRASWAEVGNDTDPYLTGTAFLAGTPFNSQPTFTSQNTIPNQNLLPERTSAVELGTDLRFLDDRYRLDVTWYNNVTKNQILALPIAQSSGYEQQVVNGGAVQTRGIEVLLSAKYFNQKALVWNSALNFSRSVSRIKDLPEGTEKITLAYSRVYDNVNQTVWFQAEEGGKIGDIYGTGYLKNENHDFIIDSSGRYIADNSLQLLGNYNPDFILGWHNQFAYKNWDFGFLMDWRQGGILVSRTLSLAAVGGQLIETENRPDEGIVAEGVVNVGTESDPIWEENTKAISAETYYRQFYDRNHEENNIYDASYLKLRELWINYTFRGSAETGLLKTGRQLSVGLMGRNLFAFSQIPHFDPEQSAVQGNNFVRGVEDMSYPTARSFGLKLAYKL